jgi:hypothetical protein
MILPHFLPHPRPLFTQEEKPRALRYAWGWFRVRVECRYQSTTLPSPLVTTLAGRDRIDGRRDIFLLGCVQSAVPIDARAFRGPPRRSSRSVGPTHRRR